MDAVDRMWYDDEKHCEECKDMEWLSNIAFLVFGLISGWLLKHYFPTYLEKKAENLATKEDIQEITRLTEETQQAFRKELERFNVSVNSAGGLT